MVAHNPIFMSSGRLHSDIVCAVPDILQKCSAFIFMAMQAKNSSHAG